MKRSFFVLLCLVFILTACSQQPLNVADFPLGTSFADARKAAKSAENTYECMEMDHPENKEMFLECAPLHNQDEDHLCYTFADKNGVYKLSGIGCANNN